MLRPAAGALILVLAMAVASSVALLGGPASEADSRMREIGALLESTRQVSALCKSAPGTPKRRSE